MEKRQTLQVFLLEVHGTLCAVLICPMTGGFWACRFILCLLAKRSTKGSAMHRCWTGAMTANSDRSSDWPKVVRLLASFRGKGSHVDIGGLVALALRLTVVALHQAGTSCVIEYCAETEVWTGTAGGTAAIQSLAGSTMGSNFLSPTPPWFQDPLGLNDRACNQSKENPAPPPPPVRVLPGFAALGACTRTIGLPCTLLSTHISTS